MAAEMAASLHRKPTQEKVNIKNRDENITTTIDVISLIHFIRLILLNIRTRLIRLTSGRQWIGCV